MKMQNKDKALSEILDSVAIEDLAYVLGYLDDVVYAIQDFVPHTDVSVHKAWVKYAIIFIQLLWRISQKWY